MPAAAFGVNAKPCWAEEAILSTWSEWPPMPAPPSIFTSTLVGSDELVVCAGFHVARDARSAAAVLTASSLVLIVVRSVLCCWTAIWRIWTAVTLFCSIAISCEMIDSVSRPEARPVSEIGHRGLLRGRRRT